MKEKLSILLVVKAGHKTCSQYMVDNQGPLSVFDDPRQKKMHAIADGQRYLSDAKRMPGLYVPFFLVFVSLPSTRGIQSPG